MTTFAGAPGQAATRGERRLYQRMLCPMTKHKKRRLIDKIEELEPQYIKHMQKLKEAELAGGYTSSIKKEIRAWTEKKDRYRRRL